MTIFGYMGVLPDSNDMTWSTDLMYCLRVFSHPWQDLTKSRWVWLLYIEIWKQSTRYSLIIFIFLWLRCCIQHLLFDILEPTDVGLTYCVQNAHCAIRLIATGLSRRLARGSTTRFHARLIVGHWFSDDLKFQSPVRGVAVLIANQKCPWVCTQKQNAFLWFTRILIS